MLNEFDRELSAYYTDVEHLRELFKEWVAAPTLPKRLLVIHGVGGVGKTSLLRMFRLHCKSVHVPVALASGDEERSAVDILARWTRDLKSDGVALLAFTKTFSHYRQLQVRAEQEATKAAEELAKGTAKTLTVTVHLFLPGREGIDNWSGWPDMRELGFEDIQALLASGVHHRSHNGMGLGPPIGTVAANDLAMNDRISQSSFRSIVVERRARHMEEDQKALAMQAITLTQAQGFRFSPSYILPSTSRNPDYT